MIGMDYDGIGGIGELGSAPGLGGGQGLDAEQPSMDDGGIGWAPEYGWTSDDGVDANDGVGYITPRPIEGMYSPMARIGGEMDLAPTDNKGADAMFKILSEKFPDIRAKHDQIYRDVPGARKYLDSIWRRTPKRTKFWFYVLGTDVSPSINPDLRETLVQEAKHIEKPFGAVIDHITPEPILDSILGLGPKIMLNQLGLGREKVDPDRIPLSGVGNIDLGGAMGELAKQASGAGPMAEMAKSAMGLLPKMGSYFGDVISFFAKLFKFHKPPDVRIGRLGTRVLAPLLLLEVDWKGQDTGVPSRLTKDTLTGNKNIAAGLVKQAEKAGQLSAQQAQVVKTQAAQMGAQAGQTVQVNRAMLATTPAKAVTMGPPAGQDMQLQTMWTPGGGISQAAGEATGKEKKSDNTLMWVALGLGGLYLLSRKGK